MKIFSFIIRLAMTAVMIFVMFLLIRSDWRKIQPKLGNNPLMSYLIAERNQVKAKAQLVTLNHYLPSFDYLADFASGKTERIEDKFSESIYYYKKVIEYLPPFQADAYGMIGFCQYQLGERQQAVSAFEKAIELNPLFFWFYHNLGVIHFINEDYQKAADALQKAVALPAQITLKIISSSKIYLDILREMTAEQYNPTQQWKVSQRDCYEVLAACYFSLNDFHKMAAVALRAAELNQGKNPRFYYYAGIASYELREYSKAIFLLEESLRADPGNLDAYYYLEESLRALGKEIEIMPSLLQKARLFHQQEGFVNLLKKRVRIRMF